MNTMFPGERVDILDRKLFTLCRESTLSVLLLMEPVCLASESPWICERFTEDGAERVEEGFTGIFEREGRDRRGRRDGGPLSASRAADTEGLGSSNVWIWPCEAREKIALAPSVANSCAEMKAPTASF